MKRLMLGLAVASWGLVSAGAANAATFVFDVSVDEQWDRVGQNLSFLPFKFQQTWDITSKPETFETTNGTGSSYYYQTDFGVASAGYSPLTAPITDLVDISGPHSFSYGAIKIFEYPLAGPPIGTYDFSLHNEIRTSVDLGDGKVLEKYYLRAINGYGAYPVTDDGVLDEAGVARLLAGVGPLRWLEWGNASIHDTKTGYYYPVAQVNYFGTAQFVGLASAVPEPTTWALMICGFGAVGVFLRRPRPQAA